MRPHAVCLSLRRGSSFKLQASMSNNQPTGLDSGGAARRPSAGQRAGKCAPSSSRPHLELQPGPSTSTSNTLGQQDSTLLLGGEPLPPSRRRRRRRQGDAHRTSRQHSCPILACVSKSRVTRHRGHTRSSEARRNPVRLLRVPWPVARGRGPGVWILVTAFEPSFCRSLFVDGCAWGGSWIVRPIRGRVVCLGSLGAGAGSLHEGSNVRPAAGGGV